MGEAKRRRLAGEMNVTVDRAVLDNAARTVARYMRAAGRPEERGADCTLHAALLQALLGRLGVQARAVAGYAAWRTGVGAGDVVGHHPDAGAAPIGPQTFLGHAWVEAGRYVVDATTWQWAMKLAQLDALDGRCSRVEWPMDVLIADRRELSPYRQVKNGYAFAAHYEERPEFRHVLIEADPADVDQVLFLHRNPDVEVAGEGA